jgi:hypothetical protein
MIYFRAIVLFTVMVVCSTRAHAGDSWESQLKSKRLLLTISGKGSSIPYDAGVVKRAFEDVPALRENQTIMAGNSSGSILAAYFSCFGLSQASVDYAAYKIVHADVTAIRTNENGLRKVALLARNQPTEISPENLREYMAFVLGVSQWQGRTIADIVAESRVRPVYPVVIATGNKEVLDSRTSKFLVGQDQKVFDVSTYSVSWKPEVYEFYRTHPGRFEQDHPQLKLGDTPFIGKACTCFVNRPMFDLLARIPYEERLCDLRLIETPEDLALAINASVAEPSYFPPVPEMHPERVFGAGQFGNLGNSRSRTYCGGFIMPLIAQDVRRMLPTLRVLGSGWCYVPMSARKVIQSWYLVDIRPVAQSDLWWVDLEASPSRETQNAMIERSLTSQQEFDAGYKYAGQCFRADLGLPEFVLPPAFGSAAAAALTKPTEADLVPAGEQRPGQTPALRTMRGLGPLLKPPGI